MKLHLLLAGTSLCLACSNDKPPAASPVSEPSPAPTAEMMAPATPNPVVTPVAPVEPARVAAPGDPAVGASNGGTNTNGATGTNGATNYDAKAVGSGPPDTSTPHAVDNTAVNERDRSSAAVTPMDQGNSAGDRDITQRIRKAVVADKSLSFTAKNVKIITKNGRVALRGPVKTSSEKNTIDGLARQVAGDQVDDLLDVKK